MIFNFLMPVVASVSANDLTAFDTVCQNHYHPLLLDLRNGVLVKKSDLNNAFSADPFLVFQSSASGHNNFKCDLLGLTFTVVAHGNPAVDSPGICSDYIRNIQTYINTFKLYVQNPGKPLAKMNKEDWIALKEAEDTRYETYSGSK